MKPRLRSVPWIVPPKVYRPGRRISPQRQRGTWTWRPDSFIERADAWLWSHPLLQTVLGVLLFTAFLLVCAWLLFSGEGRT